MCPVSWVMVDDLRVEQGLESFEPEVVTNLNQSMPVVVLGAEPGDDDRMLFLRLRSEDEQKPVTPRELLARVREVVDQLASSNERKPSKKDERELISFGNVRIDMTSLETTVDGRQVLLTRQEYKIVQYFAKYPNRVVTREVLLNEVWGYNNYPTTRTVDNHMLRLRHKLEPDPACPRYYLTMHGAGYKFVPAGSAQYE